MNHGDLLYVLLGLLAVAVCGVAKAADEPPRPTFEQHNLFKPGEGGYDTYRIPSMVVTNRGTVLAFCEARSSLSDYGNIDLVVRRSTDGGKTWSGISVVADDGDHTMHNPCPVVEGKSGTIWLPFCRNYKQVLLMKSTDDGRTWTGPVDITTQALNPAWPWVGTGPGHGIQLASGRLLIPCWTDDTPTLGNRVTSYVFVSDDAGTSWKVGGVLDQNASSECEAVELADGSIYMSMRRRGGDGRAFAFSKDGGLTWSAVQHDPTLPSPRVQGSVVRLTIGDRDDRNRVLLAFPDAPKGRRDMTVRLSYDECRTWPAAKLVHEGPSAYCDLAVTQDHQILLLYEADDGAEALAKDSAYARLTLARFNLAWLTDGKDHARNKGE